MEFDLENPLPTTDEEQHRRGFSHLFAAESDHMVSAAAAITLSARRNAVSLVLQAQFDRTVDPFVVYLAVNYIDRFLSKRNLPREKPWIVRLLSISCLSLASKMKNTPFATADFQREKVFMFDGQIIRRMELLVLGALDWRMRSITPFSFLQFFVSFFAPAEPTLLQALRAHAIRILLKAQNEIKMIEFRPSVVAASALLSAAYELFPIHFPAFRAAVSTCEFVNKGELSQCSSVMVDAAEVKGCCNLVETARVSSSDTPATVLGRRCSSSESEFTVGSLSDGRDIKKCRTPSTPPAAVAD